MNRRPYRVTFRMSKDEYDRFDRVRQSRGLGYYPWSTFILDAIARECARSEEANPNLKNRPATVLEKIVDACAGRKMSATKPVSPAKLSDTAGTVRRRPKKPPTKPGRSARRKSH